MRGTLVNICIQHGGIITLENIENQIFPPIEQCLLDYFALDSEDPQYQAAVHFRSPVSGNSTFLSSGQDRSYFQYCVGWGQ
jgi:hypothetical protein